MTTQPHIDRARATHHKALEALARQCGGPSRHTGLNLWRRLRRIEQRTAVFAEQYSNGVIDEATWDTQRKAAHEGVTSVLGAVPRGFFVNGDPRGYALKLEPGSVPFPLHTDWGGYMILAPVIE